MVEPDPPRRPEDEAWIPGRISLGGGAARRYRSAAMGSVGFDNGFRLVVGLLLGVIVGVVVAHALGFTLAETAGSHAGYALVPTWVVYLLVARRRLRGKGLVRGLGRRALLFSAGVTFVVRVVAVVT